MHTKYTIEGLAHRETGLGTGYVDQVHGGSDGHQ